MQKLVYTTDDTLLQEQLRRTKAWLDDRINAISKSSATADML